MPRSKTAPRYPLHQSALYKVTSPQKLAKILQIGLPKLTEVQTLTTDRYKPVRLKKKDGSPRFAVNPRYDLKRIQNRIKVLLNGVELPTYVHNLGDSRSHVSNAKEHVGKASFLLLDVANFFPTVTWRMVYNFFTNTMKCPGDVTKILTDIICHEDALPQGSPCSPVVAFWCTKYIWDSVQQVAERDGHTFSLYADDVSISAALNIPAASRHDIIQIIERSGLSIKKEKRQDIGRGGRDPVITGCRVGLASLRPRRKILARIRKLESRKAAGHATSIEEERSLRGLRAHVDHVSK